MEYKYDVFISYSRKDYLDSSGELLPGNVISVIVDALQKNDVTYWMDEKGDLTGKMFAHVIAEKIRESRCFLLVCSKNSVESKWVDRELSAADSWEKQIIPFICDDSYMDDRVVLYTASLGHVKYSENPQKALDKLIKTIKGNARERKKGTITLQRIEQNDHWGFADETGKIVIPCIYNAVTYFQEGLACVESDKRKWGFVDEKGNEIIPCKWEDVGFFSEGLAYAEDAFGRIGFIDKKGKVVIPCQWEDVAPFFNGKAFVKDANGTWLRIDKSGNVVE